MTQPAAQPQYSPDGRYWWDGYQWVAVPTAPPSPPVSPPYAGYGYQSYGVPAQFQAMGGFTIGAMVCGAIALLFFPILLGPLGIVLGAVGMSRKEKNAAVGLAAAGGGMVLGMILGVLVATA